MFVLINNVFLSFWGGVVFIPWVFGDASTIETLNGLKGIGGNVYNGTLGIILSSWRHFLSAWRWRKSARLMRWPPDCFLRGGIYDRNAV